MVDNGRLTPTQRMVISQRGLSLKQRRLVSREISKEFRRQRVKPIIQRKARGQIIAIGFSKARKVDPTIPELEENNPMDK